MKSVAKVTIIWCLILQMQYVKANIDTLKFPLIPYPTNLTAGQGYFKITAATIIVTDDFFKTEANLLSELFRNSFGVPLKQQPTAGNKMIRLRYDASIKNAEAYSLHITAKEMTISASNGAGIFRAIQTIRQLLPASIENKNSTLKKELQLPALTIQDSPAFEWRGMHLDVSRHFFSIAYLKKYIDVMALYKFNKLHLHLTDDQGWRIEIKKYPKLTEAGAWRKFNHQDSACMVKAKDNDDFTIDKNHIINKDGQTLYGGYYTQQQMKAIVAYAMARHIEIIPEIDMPGHMMAAINEYNYLSCDGKSAFGELFSIPICPCLPVTYQFAQDIFTEIMAIFPSQYIHIGGDEVERSYWAKSDECKALMEKEGLKSTAELQSYFIKKMEVFFNSKGRKMIGWDEILEGGVSNTAAITYWRTWVPQAPLIAAKNGNKVIMSPGNPLYFDYQPDKNSLASVYNFNPIPQGLNKEEEKNIIGAQANLWTEQVPTEQRADYLIMPRMTALAENLWTNKRDFNFYKKRLQAHFARLDVLQVNYRFPDLDVMEQYAFTDKTILKVENPLNNSIIRYTTNGTAPTIKAAALNKPVVITQSQIIKFAIFKSGGKRGDVYDVNYKKESLAAAEIVTVKNGLLCNWKKKSFSSAVLMVADKTIDGSTTVENIIVPKEAEAASFGLEYRGFINVPEEGIYSFYLTCDDAGILKIADREVVNNDGMHAPKEKNGQVALQKGLQKFALDFVEGGGGYTLKLQYSKNGSAPTAIPSEWFKH